MAQTGGRNLLSAEKIGIEVVHARPEKQVLLALEVAAGTTVQEAIDHSGIRAEFADLVVDPERLGIFGVKARPHDKLREGDRVEIYRPLIADPKEARRKRSELQKNPDTGTS
jgi:putative ubiquitin-RnfH superfamily antitoxin RatB of RatAB toxin-antitoxin module